MSDEPKFFYANSVEIAAGNFDFGFKFMRAGTDMSTNTVQPKELGVLGPLPTVALEKLLVSVSPGLAKVMLLALYQSVDQYEKLFKTTVPVPAEVSDAFDRLFPSLGK